MWTKQADIDEYSIFMLKPNCMEQGMDKPIIDKLNGESIRIIREKILMLEPEDVKCCFLHPTEEYIQYLTGDYVRLFIVQGRNPHIAMYDFKKKIRKEYGVDKTIKNLIHTVDQGNEYHMLLQRFFPEVDQIKHCNIMDQNLVFGNEYTPEEVLEVLKYLDKKSGLRYCAVNLGMKIAQAAIQKIRDYSWNKLNICFAAEKILDGDTSALIYTFDGELYMQLISQRCCKEELSALSKKHGCQIYINNIKISENELEEYRRIIRNTPEQLDKHMTDSRRFSELRQLCNEDIHGLICFRPDISLLETEYRMDLARLLELHEGGGSAGLVQPGYFSVSSACLY